MKALLLVAHGSRRAEANAEVHRLVGAVRRRATGRFALVKVAFLEFTEPTLAEGLEACVAQGAAEVVVVPYLLSAGSHAARDIPRAVAARQKAHPEVTIRIAPHVGLAAGMADLVLAQADPQPES
jgi:sirohydrochlorin ferrochelatase